jgi:hypothetical protein
VNPLFGRRFEVTVCGNIAIMSGHDLSLSCKNFLVMFLTNSCTPGVTVSTCLSAGSAFFARSRSASSAATFLARP